MDQDGWLTRMATAVQEGDEQAALQLAQAARAVGLAPLTAIEQGFLPGIRRAGQLWEEGEYFLPELVMAAQAMKAAMGVLQADLQAGEASPRLGQVVIGTIRGDIHDIGKTLVATLLTAHGFRVTDLGVDVAIERFVEEARRLEADLICASALLTTTMAGQRELVTAVKQAGLRARVMVGGAPATREWADQIGADGYADHAMAAVEVARSLVQQ